MTMVDHSVSVSEVATSVYVMGAKTNSLPPNNICIQHEEWHSYISPVTKLPESRFGNAYYHANPHCILARWPVFFPGHVIVPEDYTLGYCLNTSYCC
jgi:hypothetical protein